MMTRYLIALALAAAVLGATYRAGVSHERTAAEARQAEHLRRAIAQAALIARQDAEILTTHAARAERIRVVYRSINEEATRYAIAHRDDDCGLDAGGLRLWTAANAGADTTVAAGGSADAAAGPAAAPLGPVAGSVAEPHSGRGAVPGLPGAPARPGRLGGAGPLPGATP